MTARTILMVDDEEVLRNLTRRVLGRSYDLLLASGVGEALEIIDSRRLDLLITDWHLGAGSGAEIISAFKKKFPAAPVILITGFLDTDDFLQQTAGLAFAARFQKPFDITVFKEEVARALGPAVEPGGGASAPGGT